MRRFFVTFVCHCEKVWWDAGYDSLWVAVRAMLDLQARVSQYLGYRITSTFCSFVDHPTPITAIADAAEVPELFREIPSSGNEIGLHIHAPVELLHTGLQDRMIASDAELLTKLGLPHPITYVAGDWVTSPKIVVYLENAGFKVDCSVYALEGVIDKFGVRIDYTKRKDLHPYRPARDDICADGDSKIVELPVSGHLPEFAHHEYEHLPEITERIRVRYDALHEGVDIFQIFWHPFEVVTLNGKDNDTLLAAGVEPGKGHGKIDVNHRVLDAVERFLMEFGRQPDVEIASAIQAAKCWAQQVQT